MAGIGGGSHLTTTVLDKVIGELWSNEVLLATVANLTMEKLVDVWPELVNKGDTVHIPSFTSYPTATAKTQETEVSPVVITPVEVNVVVNKHSHIPILEEKYSARLANYDVRRIFTNLASIGLAKKIDSDLLAEYDNLTSNVVGVAGADIDDNIVLEAKSKLDDVDVPSEDRYLIIKPSQEKALRKIPSIMAYALSGIPGMITKGELGIMLHGFKVFISTNVPTVSGETKNLAFHKDAFVLAYAQKPAVRVDYVPTWVGNLILADAIYGIKTKRETFAVKVKS